MGLKKSFADGGKQTVTVRFSNKNDTGNIIAFYAGSQHKHVDQRADAVIEDRASKGEVFMIEEGGELKTSSICYDFNRASGANPDYTAAWIELGSTRNTLSGVSLYPFIIASQVMERFLARPPEEKFVANIYDDNPTVIDFLSNKVGWDTFEPENDILVACKATKGDKNTHGAERIWLEASSKSLPHQARIVLDYIERGTTTGLDNKKTGEKVMLDLSQFPLANFWKPTLEELARGEFGKKLENGPSLSMSETRRLLEDHMNGKLPSNPKPKR